jgi:hypothetical protein
MAALATQQVPVTGLAPAYSAADVAGDTVAPGDGVVLHVKNGSGASINVTVAVPGTEYGQARPDPVVAVGATSDKFIHLPAEIADSSDHRVHVTYSAVTTVTVAALSF